MSALAFIAKLIDSREMNATPVKWKTQSATLQRFLECDRVSSYDLGAKKGSADESSASLFA